MSSARNSSVLGRLLEELSWAGSTIRNYREGGRGYENVLTAEALQGLDFLPRQRFLGEVVRRARGADAARQKLVEEIEDAEFTLLPGDHYLGGRGTSNVLSVQPDGLISTDSTYVVVEAKRIRASSFQPEQLAREYVLALKEAEGRLPLLFLLLGSPPPVKMSRHGAVSIEEGISLYLESVLNRTDDHRIDSRHALAHVDDVVCWITWGQIAEAVTDQMASFDCDDPATWSCVDRLATSVTQAITWHG